MIKIGDNTLGWSVGVYAVGFQDRCSIPSLFPHDPILSVGEEL